MASPVQEVGFEVMVDGGGGGGLMQQPEMELGEAVRQAVGMLPPSQPNSLTDFLSAVMSGEKVPALFSPQRIDPDSYYEKRRVQNLLRRFAENLQEFAGENSFERLLQLRGHSGRGSASLTEQDFLCGLQALNGFAPEMTTEDRAEVFIAFCAFSGGINRIHNTQQPLPRELTAKMFYDGLKRIPYNLPDFPVPKHLLKIYSNSSPEALIQAADSCALEIVSVFMRQEEACVKDCFLCGLITLEEIQAALQELVDLAVVEKAVEKIIRVGTTRFRTSDWATFGRPSWDLSEGTYLVSYLPEGVAEEPAPVLLVPTLSPNPGNRDLRVAPEGHTLFGYDTETDTTVGDREVDTTVDDRETYTTVGDRSLEDVSIITAGAGSSATEPPPLPRSVDPQQRSRDLLHEAPVTFAYPLAPAPNAEALAPAAAPVRQPVLPTPIRRPGFFVDWSTTGRVQQLGEQAVDQGHPADQGAGVPPELGELAHPGSPSNDPLSWIDRKMHTDCRGPYFTDTFVRCCQLYGDGLPRSTR
jgi:hypothetical protein